MKPKAQGPHDEGFLEYLEDIIGTNQYVEKIDEAFNQWVIFQLSIYISLLEILIFIWCIDACLKILLISMNLKIIGWRVLMKSDPLLSKW